MTNAVTLTISGGASSFDNYRHMGTEAMEAVYANRESYTVALLGEDTMTVVIVPKGVDNGD